MITNHAHKVIFLAHNHESHTGNRNLRMTITQSEITNMPFVVGSQSEIVFIEYKKNPPRLKELLERAI